MSRRLRTRGPDKHATALELASSKGHGEQMPEAEPEHEDWNDMPEQDRRFPSQPTYCCFGDRGPNHV